MDIKGLDAFNFRAEKLNSEGKLFMCRNKINKVSPYPELTGSRLNIITNVMEGNQLFQKEIPIFFHAGTQFDNLRFPVFRRTQTINTRN